MLIKTRCPACKKIIFPNIRYSGNDPNIFRGIEVEDIKTEEELAKNIIPEIRKIIRDGIEIETINGVLQERYQISAPACKGLIDRIKLELDMYSPDRKRLFYV